jgi:hypothetical protein
MTHSHTHWMSGVVLGRAWLDGLADGRLPACFSSGTQNRKEVVFWVSTVVRGQGFGSQRPPRHAYTRLAKGILFLERLPAPVGGASAVRYCFTVLSLVPGLMNFDRSPISAGDSPGMFRSG